MRSRLAGLVSGALFFSLLCYGISQSGTGKNLGVLVSTQDPAALSGIPLEGIDPSAMSVKEFLEVLEATDVIVLDLSACTGIPLNEISRILEEKEKCLIVLDSLQQEWDLLPVEGKPSADTTFRSGMERFGPGRVFLSEAIEDNEVSLPDCRIKPGATLDVVATSPSGLLPVVASWGWRGSYIVGVVPSLAQIREWTGVGRILSEIIRYAQAELEREIPVITPASDVILSPPFDSMGPSARWWQRLYHGGGIHAAGNAADDHGTSFIQTDSTADHCADILIRNNRVFARGGPTQGTEIEPICKIDGDDYLSRMIYGTAEDARGS